MYFRIFLFLILLNQFSTYKVYSQSTTPVELRITDLETGYKIPYVHIILDDTLHLYSDMEGKATLPYLPDKLFFKQPYYSSYQTNSLDNGDIKLTHNKQFKEAQGSDIKAEALIKKVLSWKKINRESKKKYTYKSYNKFSVSTEKSEHPKKLIDKILKYLSYDLEGRDRSHLFLMESVSEMQHLSPVKKKERIIGMHSTGIQLPSTYTSYVHPNPFTLYNNWINIANTKYISPLCQSSYVTYAYEIIDTAYVEKDTIFTLKFYPHPSKSISAARGLLYINSNGYAAQYFIGSPLKQGKLRIEACQEYKYRNAHWFPSSYRTDFSMSNFSGAQINLILSARSYIFDFSPGIKRNRKDFSEIVLEYDSLSKYMPDDLWEQYRQEDLSEKDLRTFSFFDSTEVQKRQEEILKLGERIYFGEIPFGKVNLNLNKIFYTNYLEGLRLGLGFHTNEKFSTNWKVGTYFGYGFKDRKWKYGADVSYRFNDRMETVLGVGIKRDVYEAGAQFFPFDLIQYSTEPLRKYRLHILDYINESSSILGFRPLKYLRMNLAYTMAEHIPSYDYQFIDKISNRYKFTEISSGFRYAYGEEYIKTPTKTLYLGTKFPIVWFNLTKGIKNALWGDYNYTRFDLKIQQTFKFFRFGTSGVQILGGITNGFVPYTKLYNMRGSLRMLSVVIHNSFETMNYNEFLSDRFFALFYSHDFGQIYSPNPNFRPNIVMVHNFGFGSINNPERHKNIQFKTMEKGYFESGIFLKNLIVVNLSGLKTGLGLGLFARYGPYEHRRLGDNLVFKLSTNFLL